MPTSFLQKYYSYNGSVEGDRYAEEIIKKQRIQRLQEVRKYGSKLSRDRCKVYNEKLNQRLRLKGELARDARVEDLKSEYNTVLNRFKKALVDNGQAHRDALDNAVITIHKFEAQQEVKEYKEAAIAERGQEALVKRKKQIVLVKQKKERLKKNREAVVERSKSDREHAKASAESREAKAKAEKKRMDLVDNGPLVIDQDHSTNSASSAKLMQKGGFSAVKAKVMKHGATRADISIVNNTATVAAIDSLKKRMDRCLDEMKNKLRAKARAKKAIQVSTLLYSLSYYDSDGDNAQSNTISLLSSLQPYTHHSPYLSLPFTNPHNIHLPLSLIIIGGSTEAQGRFYGERAATAPYY